MFISLRIVLGVAAAALLMLLSQVVCFADYGPRADVRRARSAEIGAWNSYCRCKTRVEVPDVTVVGSYALASWESSESNGQSLLRLDHGHWHRIGHGGGGMNTADLVDYGAPCSVAKRLVEHNHESEKVERMLQTHHRCSGKRS